MPLTVAQLVARVTADTSGFYKSMAVANASMVRTGSIASRVFAGVGLATVAAGLLSLKAAGDFQQSMNLLQAVANPTTQQFKAMRKEAIDLGNDLRLPAVNAKDAADVMYDLSRSGLTVNQTMKATRGVLLLGTAANIQFGDAALIAARALKAFNLPGERANQIADLLAATTNRTTASIQDMSDGFQNASGQFASAHYSIQTLSVALAELIDKGLSGAQAGTSLKVMLQRLESPTTKAAAVMKDLGIQIFNANGSIKPFPEIINQFALALNNASDKTKAQALNTIFGQRANQAMIKLMEGGVGAWERYTHKVTEAGVAQKLADARMKGFNGALQAFTNAVSTLAIELGSSLLPLGTQLVRWAAGWLESLDVSRIQNFFATVKNVVVVAFNTVKPIIQGFISLMGTGFGQSLAIAAGTAYVLVKALSAVRAMMLALRAAAMGFSASGFGLALAGISLAVGFLVQKFFASKIAADQLASSLTVAKFSADSLKGSLDRLSQAHLDLHQAELNLAQAQLTLSQAQQRWNSDIAAGITKTQQGRQDFLALKQAQQGVKQATLDVSTASKAMTAADARRNQELNQGIIKLRDIRSKLVASAQAHEQHKLSTEALTKVTQSNLTVLGQVITQETNHANALKKTDPVAAAAARRTAEYAARLRDTLREGRPTTQSVEDFVKSLLKLPMPLVDVGKKSTDAGAKTKAALDKIGPAAKNAGTAAEQGFRQKIAQILTAAITNSTKATQAVAKQAGPMHGAGSKAGAAGGQGLADGLNSKIGAVQAAASHLAAIAEAALSGALQTKSPSRVTKRIGEWVGQGLALGILATRVLILAAAGKVSADLVGRIATQLRADGKKPIDALRSAMTTALQVQPAIDAAAKVLGMKTAMNIARGVLQQQPTLAQQIKQALRDAVNQAITDAKQAVESRRSDFASAFSNLASAALSAFDAQVAKWKPEAQRILDKLNLDKQIADLTATLGPTLMGLYNTIIADINAGAFGVADNMTKLLVEQINAQINAAQQALNTAQQNLDAVLNDPNATDEQKAAAQKAYDDAKQKLDDLLTARENILQLIAAQESTAHEKFMGEKRDQLQRELDQLRAYLNKHPGEWRNVQDKILKLLKKYIPDFKLSGKALGYEFAKGLREAIPECVAAAKALAEAIKKYLALTSPSELGPMSNLDQWWKNFAPTLLSGLNTKPITAAVHQMVMPPNITPTAGSASSSTTSYFDLTIQTPAIIGTNLEGAAKDLEPHLRKILIGIAKANGLR